MSDTHSTMIIGLLTVVRDGEGLAGFKHGERIVLAGLGGELGAILHLSIPAACQHQHTILQAMCLTAAPQNSGLSFDSSCTILNALVGRVDSVPRGSVSSLAVTFPLFVTVSVIW